MSYQLKFFEEWIISSLSNQYWIAAQKSEEIEGVLNNEKELFLLRLHYKVSATDTEEKIRICIREHQRIISYWSRCLEQRIMQMECVKDKTVFDKTATMLLDIMLLLYQSFPTHFMMEERIVGTMFHTLAAGLSQERKALNEALLSAKVENHFVERLMAPLAQQLREPDKSLSWHYYFYYKSLFKEINHFLDAITKKEELQYALWRCMVYFNFNAYGMFDYVKLHCRKMLEEAENPEEKLRMLEGWIKKFSQCHVLPGVALRQNRAPLAQQVASWLKVEKEFMFPGNKGEWKPTLIGADMHIEKPKVSLSVPRFAYLIRLLFQSSVFNAKSQTLVLRVFSNHFSTQQADNISLQSMRAHYYEPDRSTVHAIRDLLHTMLQQSKKDYP